MAAPEVSGGHSSSTESDLSTPNASRATETASRLSLLEELCRVLGGTSYLSRLTEIGIKEGKEVTPESYLWLCANIRTLKGIRESRFQQLKKDSSELIKLWETSHRAFSKGVDLNKLYAVVDAKSAADIKSEKLLSSTWLDLVKAEKDRFVAAAATKHRDKYQARKRKLVALMKLTHLSEIEDFNPNVIVVAEMHEKEAKSIKEKIKKLKAAVLKRKELVFRVEQVKTAIYERKSTSSIDVLLGRARKVAEALTSGPSGEVTKYDGHDIHIFLSNLWTMACSLYEDLDVELNNNAEVALTKPRTRSAVGVQASAGATSRQSVVTNGAKVSLDEWTKNDRKKISYLALNVANLQNTIKCYTDCFGMKVLKELQHNGKDYVFLGFESETTTFQFICKHEVGVCEPSVGQGFGHISLTNSDVRKLAKIVEVSPFCELVSKPCRLQGSSTLISFASDPDGVLFEIIESSAKCEPICRVLLYVDNIDDSMLFYQKALGMRVLKHKDEESYKMVLLSFEAEDKKFVLELRTCEDDRSYENGNVYNEIVIETQDLEKSYQVLNEEVPKHPGAQILEIPATGKKMCSFQDPDGWRWVLIDQADPDNLMHIL